MSPSVDEHEPPPVPARRRYRTTVGLLGLLVAGLVVAQVVRGGGRGTYVPSGDGPVAGTFTVPTYDWDGGTGMDAAVGGTLWFTPEGCTLMSNAEGADRVTGAVFFPNATGVTYDNGVRAVVDPRGDVFAVEGQQFSYGGGYVVTPDSELGRQWAAQCPGAELREGAVVNDEPAIPALTQAPPAPTQAGPTAPTTGEELGFYPVPSFPWDPADGGDAALIRGTVTFTDQGCPLIESDAGGRSGVVGLVFPNAEGYRDPRQGADVGPVVYSTFATGAVMMAMDGESASYSGGSGPGDDERWTRLCPDTPVESVFLVQDTSSVAQ